MRKPLTVLGWIIYGVSAVAVWAVLGFLVWLTVRPTSPGVLIVAGVPLAIAGWIGLKLGNRMRRQQADYLDRVRMLRKPPRPPSGTS